MLNITDIVLMFACVFVILCTVILFYIRQTYPNSEIAKLFKFKPKKTVRVRFAPSPTGFMHIGNVRTLLFNYFYAANQKGKLILRIEDTDEARYDARSIQYIKDVCTWLKIDFDESPFIGGQYQPYVQSERAKIYEKYVKYLLDKGYAYRAFETKEELQDCKDKLANFTYNTFTRYMNCMKNELKMSPRQLQEALNSGIDYVVRLKVPEKETIICHDYLREFKGSSQSFSTKDMDDKVLWKSSTGLPTYHLASVVDDHLMKITHVIRGDEWLSSLPYHTLLYRYFGWKEPIFVHTPVILDPTVNGGKLSKRRQYDFPIYPISFKDDKDEIEGFRENGFSREGFINFAMLNGWNPGNNVEIMSIHEIATLFSLERIKLSGAKLDFNKAKFINKKHHKKSIIESMTPDDRVEPLSKEEEKILDDYKKDKVNQIKNPVKHFKNGENLSKNKKSVKTDL